MNENGRGRASKRRPSNIHSKADLEELARQIEYSRRLAAEMAQLVRQLDEYAAEAEVQLRALMYDFRPN